MDAKTQSELSVQLDEIQLTSSLYELNDIYRKHQDYIRTKYKVSALEMEIIQYVTKEGKKKMKEIGEYFDIKLSTLTSIIDKIEQQRLVKRVNSKEDRRVVYLEITKKGEKLYVDYLRYIQVISQMMRNSLDENQYLGFISGMDTIAQMIVPQNVAVPQ